MPIFDFLIYPCLTLGVMLGNKVGPRLCVGISFAVQCLSFVILSITHSYYLVLLAMGLFGLGHALGYLTSMKNIWKYYPNNNGLVFGIVVSGSGLSASIFTPIADFLIINPNKVKTNAAGIYPAEVANRLVYFLYLATGLFILFGTIGTIGTYKYEEEEKVENVSKIEADENEETKIANSENKENKENEKKEENKKKDDLGRYPIKEALLSLKNLQILCFCFCGFCKFLFYNKNKIINIIILLLIKYSFGFSCFKL